MRYIYSACLNCLKCTLNDSEDTSDFAQRVKQHLEHEPIKQSKKHVYTAHGTKTMKRCKNQVRWTVKHKDREAHF